MNLRLPPTWTCRDCGRIVPTVGRPADPMLGHRRDCPDRLAMLAGVTPTLILLADRTEL